MRLVLSLLLLAGCTDSSDEPQLCPARAVRMVTPQWDEVVSPPAVDLSMHESGPVELEVEVTDASNSYVPGGPGHVDANRLYTVHYENLPANSTFDVKVSQLCPVDEYDWRRVKRIPLIYGRFRTGP